MIIRSKSFENDGTIPLKHTGFGEDLSPELTISDAPYDAVSFAVILDDLDVPFTKTFTHWIVWNIPGTKVIPEGLSKGTVIIPEGLPYGAVISEPIDACQGMAWGKHRYRGPKQPVFIRNEHRYVFTVYALDCRLDIPEASGKDDLIDAMRGHILAEANIIGKFKRG